MHFDSANESEDNLDGIHHGARRGIRWVRGFWSARKAVSALVCAGLLATACTPPPSNAPTDTSDLRQLFGECNDGNGSSCLRVGLMLWEGTDGLKQNDNEAAIYLKKACDADLMAGCAPLGELYFRGHGVPKDEVKGALLANQACDKEISDACEFLARRYLRGKGVKKDAARAGSLFERLCEAKNGGSCYERAQMLEMDAEEGQTPSRGAELYRKACDMQFFPACTILGIMTLYGEGGLSKNEARSAALFTKACDEGYVKGCFYLALAFRYGRGMEQNTEAAIRLFGKLCAHDVQAGCHAIALELERQDPRGADPSKSADIVSLYTTACDRGLAPSCNNLGVLFAKGRRVRANANAAASYYKRACDAESAKGCHNLAVVMGKGEGTPQDGSRALQLFEQACEDGFGMSCVELGMAKQGAEAGSYLKRGVKLLEKDCGREDGQACYRIGLLAREGLGVEKNQARALEAFDRACMLDEPEACDAALEERKQR